MNYLVVRTKLQAIISLRLLEYGYIKKPFIFISLYQYSVDEDNESVAFYYDKIRSFACEERTIVQSAGFVKYVLLFVLCFFRSFVSRGYIFISSIDFYPIAIAARIFPFIRIMSFDDGAANILNIENSYFNESPLQGNNIKRRIAKLILPYGAAQYMREKITSHYTIYPGFINIVDDNKLIPIRIKWKNELSNIDIASLPLNVKKILLGTDYRVEGIYYKDKKIKDIALFYYSLVDVYLPHPMESIFSAGEKTINIMAPAEAVIDYYSEKNNITVYHFNSSAVFPFILNSNITFVDLCA